MDGNKEELIMLNDMINGGDIPLQWKLSRIIDL